MAQGNRKITPIDQSAAVLGAVVLLGGLAFFAFTGSFARYWADDYCYTIVSRVHGLLGGMWAWYQASGNRFTTILLVGISEWFGPQAIRALPALVLAAWTAGWWVFLTRAADALSWPVRQRWLALLSLAQVYFCVLLAPDRLQTLYWRMGTLHYTFPLALLLFNLGWVAQRARKGSSLAFAIGSGLLAFFAGGLSETFAALQTGLLGVLLLGLWAARGRGSLGRAAGLTGGSLLGSLLAMGVMMLSPSNAWRLAALPPSPNLPTLLITSVRYATDFTWFSLRGQPLPLLVLAVIVSAAAFLGGGEIRLSPRAGLLGVILSLALGWVLVLCCIAPSAYAGLQYPAGRALMPARFAFLLGWSGAAGCVGLALRSLAAENRFSVARGLAVLLLLAACAYPLRPLTLLRQEAGVLALKAGRWDARDAQIRADAAAGVRAIQIPQVDVVQGLEDFSPDRDFWVNTCAAGYYQVESITALP
jgi:hypothetical protein